MDQATGHAVASTQTATLGAPISVEAPVQQTAPVVFSSPHSGNWYPPEFMSQSRLDPVGIRRSEDSFVDEIFATAPDHGAPLLKALFPRAYVDPNREAYELDPAMFADPLPDYVNTASPRVAAGLGTVARVVTNGEEIYDRPLTFADAKRRIDDYYVPYHDTLKDLINTTVRKYGVCLLIDCHSMPSIGGPMDFDRGRRRVDFVLGDNHGLACSPTITNLVDQTLTDMGFAVHRNNPYSGGFTTRHYGRPTMAVHALQIEINRAIYMNETTIERQNGFEELAGKIGELISVITSIDPVDLKNR